MVRKKIDITRRQLLQGIGGFTLALPVLPSLLTKNAYGADPEFTRAKRLLWISSDHGGCFNSSMYPSSSLATNKQNLYADHSIASGTLKTTDKGDNRVLSAVLTAPRSEFTDQLLSKMNVISGMDVPFYIAHNTGLHLGNYARNNGDGAEGKEVQAFPRPTIDQLMAWSPSFYSDLSAVKMRSIQFRNTMAWSFSSPATKSGDVVGVGSTMSAQSIFDQLFQKSTAPVSNRTPVVDRVLDSYKALRGGNSRLSTADKQRLDDHIERIHELQRRLKAATVSCGDVTRPAKDSTAYYDHPSVEDAPKFYRIMIDVLTAAFICGSSRIGSIALEGSGYFVEYAGDWHQEIFHQWFNPSRQELIVKMYQRTFSEVLLYAASSLDVEEAPGMTYLDNTLVAWTQESGMETHGSTGIPIVTFGSAGGYFKTGLFADYRRVGNAKSSYKISSAPTEEQVLGVLYSQWLANVGMSMNLKPSEFELWGHKGYGYPYVSKDNPYAAHYGDTKSRYFMDASNPLPMITA